MSNGRNEPFADDAQGSLSIRANCPRCGKPLHDAPYHWGLAVVRELEHPTDAEPDELVTRCADRTCRIWVACTYSRKVA